MPINCFNGFQKLFEEDAVLKKYPQLNPTLGFVFSTTHLARNLRLYGNYNFGWGRLRTEEALAPEHRIYSEDEPLDPIAFVIKELFPSVGGTLTTSVARDLNIGHRLLSANKENQLKALALLLKIVVKSREHDTSVLEKLKDEFLSLLKIRPGSQFRITFGTFVKNISESIQLCENSNFYPKYLTEQIFLGFIWEFLNTKEELDIFLNELKQCLCDGGLQETIIIEEFDQTKFHQLTKKINQGVDECNVDECNYEELLQYKFFSESFNNPTPYRSGETLISNGSCNMYDLGLGNFTEILFFADCVETTIRHIVNIALFDKTRRQFYCPENCSEFVKSFYNNYQLS